MLLPTISTFFILLSAIFIAIGWRMIIKGKKKEHKVTMIIASISALTFFIIYMSRTIFLGNTAFPGPAEIEIYYIIFLIFHIILATTGGIFGIISLRLAFKKKIDKHEKLGPYTSIIWFGTAITGIMVYLFLYVFWGVGETTNLFRAIWSL